MTIPPKDLWSISAELVPLHGGHRNAAFRTVGLETDLVLKSSRRTPEAIEWLLDVHEAARAAGFVVPTSLRSTAGGCIGAGWTCETFVPGRPLAPGELASILPLLDRFHTLARGMGQRPGFLAAEDLIDRAAGGDIDLSRMPEGDVAACRAAWRGIRGRPGCAIHGDVNASNVIRCDDGRFALIDWDEARVDAPVFDVGQIRSIGRGERRALLAWEVACSWCLEPASAQDARRRLMDL